MLTTPHVSERTSQTWNISTLQHFDMLSLQHVQHVEMLKSGNVEMFTTSASESTLHMFNNSALQRAHRVEIWKG